MNLAKPEQQAAPVWTAFFLPPKRVIGPSPAQSVSKLEIPRFSSVTLPLPNGNQANTERSDESSFRITGRGARFDTLWARSGH